jgi:hypothetical protein
VNVFGQWYFQIELEDIDSGTTSPTGQYRWRDVADNIYDQNYIDSYNYTEADVLINYWTDSNTLHGTLSAFNLKPNFAYQLKVVGYAGTAANELIGLVGRWWQEEWNGAAWVNGHNLNDKGDGNSPNPNDYDYFDRRDVNDITSPTGKNYRFTAYLVFDYFVTDSNGNATLEFDANSCYHVLWKTGQSYTHTADDGPVKSVTFDPNTNSAAYDTDYAEATEEIFGEWERLPVGGVTLLDGSYEVSFVLTEESFHNCGLQYGGCWAGAMAGDVYFVIPACLVDYDYYNQLSQEWLSSGIHFDVDDSNK